MTPTCRVCVVVPCYNEAQRLDVAGFRRYLAASSQVCLLFVDDGSRDGTAAVLEAVRAGNEDRAYILRCQRNGGKAEAVRLGILQALDELHPEIVGFWDADLATPLSSIAPLLAVLDREAEIHLVFGARVKLLGRHVERLASRHYLGRIFATMISALLRIPIYDSQCGAKLLRVGPETRAIFAEKFISKWVFDVEILARYLVRLDNDPQKLAHVIYEYPLEKWTDVAGSKVRPSDFLTAFWDVLKIRRKYL